MKTVTFGPMQTVTASSGVEYTLSRMFIRWVDRPRRDYALVKTATGQYFVAEYEQAGWTGSNRKGWNQSVDTPMVCCLGTGKASGKEAVDGFLNANRDRLVKKTA